MSKSTLIHTLPTDSSKPTEQEEKLLAVFANDEPQKAEQTLPTVTSNAIVSELKECVIIIILFVLFGSEKMKELLSRFIPIAAKNEIVNLIIRCAIVIVLYYFAKNFKLIRKD